MTTKAPSKTIHFFINGHRVSTSEADLSGGDIKALGSVPAGETLYLRRGNRDIPVADDETVKLRNGMKFESAPDGGVS